MLRRQAQQGQRQANVVVEVAGGGQHRVGAGVATQNRRQHFLDRGLAVGAGDANAQRRQAERPAGGQPAQGQAGVLYLDQAGAGQVKIRAHQRGRALGDNLGDEVVGVEAFALQGDEQIAGTGLAAIGHYAQDVAVRAAQSAPGQFGGLQQRHHARSPQAVSASSATRKSENGRLTPAMSWYSSWPLPATSTTSPARAWPTAQWMAASRSTSR